MRAAKILLFTVCLSLAILLPGAQAATLSVTPTGSFNAAGISTITYNVDFNVGAGESVTWATWQYELDYDGGELASPVGQTSLGQIYTQTSGIFAAYSSIVPKDSSSLLLDFPSFIDLSAGSYRLASVTFSITDPKSVFDGLPDFTVLSYDYNNVYGMLSLDVMDYVQKTSMNGADVGVAPVPVPAAAWLLGSGLVGLIGLRRRMRG